MDKIIQLVLAYHRNLVLLIETLLCDRSRLKVYPVIAIIDFISILVLLSIVSAWIYIAGLVIFLLALIRYVIRRVTFLESDLISDTSDYYPSLRNINKKVKLSRNCSDSQGRLNMIQIPEREIDMMSKEIFNEAKVCNNCYEVKRVNKFWGLIKIIMKRLVE